MAEPELADDLRPEYDLSSLRVRRTGPGRQSDPHLTVTIDDDVAEVFTTPEAVNRALRAFIAAIPDARKTA